MRTTAVCPACQGELRWGTVDTVCVSCGRRYKTCDGIPLLVWDDSPYSAQQAAWFDVDVDETFEIERPHGAPVLYAWLLREKFRRSRVGLDLRGATALTVCGGSGMDAEFLARAGAQVIASDISIGAARRARDRSSRHYFPIDVVVADAARLPFADRSIDVVYVHDGLHHLEDPLVGLAEMARVARRAVCVTEPARAALTSLAVRLGLALEQEEAGNRVARLTLDHVRSSLAACGFRVVRAERYAMYYRHEPGRAVRLLSHQPWFFLARFAFRVANALAGSLGNKLTVQAVRESASSSSRSSHPRQQARPPGGPRAAVLPPPDDATDPRDRSLRVVVHDYSGHPFQVQLSRELARRGNRVLHLHCPSYVSGKGSLATGPDDPASFAVDAVSLESSFARHSPWKRVLQELEYGRALTPHVRRFRPDVVLSSNTPLIAQHVLQRECRRLGAAVIYWQQDLYGEAMKRGAARRIPVIGRGGGEAFVALERRIVRDSDAVVAISADFTPTLRQWGISDTKATVIENWAPLEEVRPAPRDNAWARAHGLVGPMVILYAGTLGMKHNPDVLLGLAERFRDDNLRVVVVSEGSGREWLQREAERRRLSNVLLLDFQPYDALSLVLASADVLTVILEPDAGVYSVPSKVLTYHCAGRPLLAALPASNLAAGLIARAGSGFVCDPLRPDMMATSAERLVSDAGLRRSMGKAARTYAEQAFDIGEITDRFETVISGAVQANLWRTKGIRGDG